MAITRRLLSTAMTLAFVCASAHVAGSQTKTQPHPSTRPAPAAGRAQAAAQSTTPQPAAPQAAPASTGPQLEPQGYTYNPDGRRDPFVSLLRRGADTQKPTIGSRAAGLTGLETGEVTLKGTVASQGGFVGILQGSDQKTYIVKAGDKLLDGTIRTINQDSMVITQQVNDPLSLEKQREVRKVLRQTEEAK
jgi:Tfp pilus assembly protein PilP